MNRSEFIKTSGTALLSIFGISLISCKSDTEANAESNLKIESIESNHGGEFNHNAVSMTISDVESGTIKEYTLSGGAHQHVFTPTAQQMADLKTGVSVVFTATGVGHMHDVTLKYSK